MRLHRYMFNNWLNATAELIKIEIVVLMGFYIQPEEFRTDPCFH